MAVLGALLRPQRLTLWALRAAMLVVGLGGLAGMVIHLLENLAFEQEIRPNAAAAELFGEALKGASPLFAPGVLVFAALVALIATYAHPALNRRE